MLVGEVVNTRVKASQITITWKVFVIPDTLVKFASDTVKVTEWVPTSAMLFVDRVRIV